MYLHLGQETTVCTREVVGIFDLDTCTISAKTREFLSRAEKAGRVVNTSMELPKSFVVAAGENTRVYICQNSGQTIKNRLGLAGKETPGQHKKMLE